MTQIQTAAIVLGLFISGLPSALGGLMSGDNVLGAGYYFASLGDLFLFIGSLVLFLNLLGALYFAIKNCGCLARICGGLDKKEVNA